MYLNKVHGEPPLKKITLKARNRTRGNTSYVIRHSIEEANCSPSETIKGKCLQSANMYM